MHLCPGNAVGPVTSHVMWTYPLDFGGLVGGETFSDPGTTYFEGSAYNTRFENPIIVDGYLYYQEPVTFTGYSSGATVCQDLRTGQIIWTTTQIPALSFAYVYRLYDPNQHGGYPTDTVHKWLRTSLRRIYRRPAFQRNRRPIRHSNARSIRRATEA